MLSEFIIDEQLVKRLSHTGSPNSFWHEQPYSFELSYARPEFEASFEYGKMHGIVLNAPERGTMRWVDDNFLHAWIVYQHYIQVVGVEAVILWDMGNFPEDEEHTFCYCIWADTEELL